MKQDVTILEGERVDDLQFSGLHIIQKTRGFRFGMDAVLLADFASVKPGDHFADFGTGTGILPLLLIARGKGEQCEAIEIQHDYANLAERNVRMNGYSDCIHIHEMDVTVAAQHFERSSLDAIICNPPYGMPGETLHNPDTQVKAARHQSGEGLLPWFKAAHSLLKGHGKFCMICPAPQMLQVMKMLENARLQPKRFRLVYPDLERAANLVLIEAVKDAKPLLKPEPPLIVRRANGEMTDEMLRIYHISNQEKD